MSSALPGRTPRAQPLGPAFPSMTLHAGQRPRVWAQVHTTQSLARSARSIHTRGKGACAPELCAGVPCPARWPPRRPLVFWEKILLLSMEQLFVLPEGSSCQSAAPGFEGQICGVLCFKRVFCVSKIKCIETRSPRCVPSGDLCQPWAVCRCRVWAQQLFTPLK